MTRYFSTILMSIFLVTGAASAQQGIVWVQVEAQPTLADAQARARAYATRLPDVNGFALNSGWYGIALGPYTAADAEQVLQVYRAEGTIASDSFIAYSASFRQQFWPVGANLLGLPAAQPDPVAAEPEPQVSSTPSKPEQTPVALLDENPREARDSEAALSREEREALQVALKWAGFYDSSIDGAFGRGTRASMAAWQEAYGYEATGVLTTRQRAALLKQYNAVLEGLGLELVRDETAGIEIELPMGVLAFDRYEPPFAHYSATGDIDAKVLLISQEGDENTLFGLYDIMQTLEIVPEVGPRERKDKSFLLIGEGAQRISHTEARLENGYIKGFTLIWPAGDEERRSRLLGEMRASFAATDGALDPAAGSNEGQSIDLISGLEIRRPKLSRSGFYVDATGTVVTTLQAVESCRRISIETDHDAAVVARDDTLGLAVLQASERLAPAAVAIFREGEPRLQSEVSVAGYSYEGLLGAPTLTYGRLADIKGLRGEAGLNRLALEVLPGDAGGPVLDADGTVLGMLLPRPEGGRKLPDEVNFALNSAVIRGMLDKAGVTSEGSAAQLAMAPEDLAVRAHGMTVLVSCWE